MLFLPEHAGTLYFTREYACRHFYSNKNVFAFDPIFPTVFVCVFLQVGHAETRNICVNASAEAKKENAFVCMNVPTYIFSRKIQCPSVLA